MKLKYRYYKKERGFILVYALIFCFFISFILFGIYTVKYSYYSRLTHHKYFLQSFFMADKILKTLDGADIKNFLTVLNSLNNADIEGFQTEIKFESENAKLNINFLNQYPHQNVLRPIYNEILQKQGFSRYCFDSTLDWLDADDILRLLGAESSNYTNFGYKSKNSSLHTVDELILINGFYKNDIDFIKKIFTVHGNGKINPALFAIKVSELKGAVNLPLSFDEKDPAILSFMEKNSITFNDLNFIFDFSNTAYKINILISRGKFTFPLTAFFENENNAFTLKRVFYLQNY